MDDSISKDLLSAVWLLALGMSLILNFNVLLVLIIDGWQDGWQWILNNWLCDILPYIILPYYILVHSVIVFGFKTAMTRLN